MIQADLEALAISATEDRFKPDASMAVTGVRQRRRVELGNGGAEQRLKMPPDRYRVVTAGAA